MELLRLLPQQRALYDMPRDMDRFRAYIAQMTGGSDDILLPIGAMNPMGKDKAVAAYDSLLAVQAEDVAERTLESARHRLSAIRGSLRVAVVVLDDAQGMWSSADEGESSQWESDALAKRGFAVAQFLSSKAPYTAAKVGPAVLAAVYNSAWLQSHGVPKTLGDVLQQVGFRAAFAGLKPALGADALAHASCIVAAHLSARAKSPEAYAAMFGDEQARARGITPLGLPARAGFELALAQALGSTKTPETALQLGAPAPSPPRMTKDVRS